MKVPVEESTTVPFAAGVMSIAVSEAFSVSVSFVNSDVFGTVVCVTVPPSKTSSESVTVTGGSFTAIIFTKNTSWVVLQPLVSSTNMVMVVVPFCSAI